MSSARLLLGFSSELVVFVVAAGGLAILLSERAGRWLGRFVLAAGLAALAAAALARGTDLAGPDAGVVAILRAAAFAGLGAGTWWGAADGDGERSGAMPGPAMLVAPALAGPAMAAIVGAAVAGLRRSGRLMAISLIVFATADAVRMASSGPVADVVQVGAAVLLGTALLRAAVRSVSGRFVISAAALLTLLIVALSIVLSVVIESRLRTEAADRAVTGVTTEIENLSSLQARSLSGASLLTSYFGDPDTEAKVLAGDRSKVEQVVTTAVQLLGPNRDADFVALVVPFTDTAGAGYVIGGADVTARADGTGVEARPLAESERAEIGAAPVVLSALGTRDASGFQPLGGSDVLVLGAAHVERGAPARTTLVTVVGFRLDRGRLAALQGPDPNRATYLVTPTGLVQSPDAPPLPDELIAGIRSEVIASDRALSGSAGSRFASARSLGTSGGAPVGALVVTVSGDLVVSARRTIFRALFVTALAGVLVAVGLAALAGRRITAPLRAVTDAAGRLRGGDLGARTGVRTADEVGALGVAFDGMAGALEEQAGALRAAADEEAYLRRQVEGVMMSMNDAVIAVDLSGTVTAVNRAAEELLREPMQRMVGLPISGVVTGVDVDGRPLGDRLAAIAPPWSARATILRDDERVPVAVSRTTITDDDGEPTGGVVVVRDVTEEQALERMKSDFLANVSHELRTPLTPIKGYSALLLRRKLPPEMQRQFLAEIGQSAERLERIVGILVDFAALEAGRLETAKEPVAVDHLLERVTASWNGRSPGHRLSTDVEAELPPVVGDEDVLARALLELVDNGVKYSPDGGTVMIRARTSDGVVRIEVHDEGIGFDASRLPELMAEFRQADASSTRRFGGLGLGLPFARRIAEAHGGQLVAESEPGHGSTFALDLPAGRR